jgi:hypothetical protein
MAVGLLTITSLVGCGDNKEPNIEVETVEEDTSVQNNKTISIDSLTDLDLEQDEDETNVEETTEKVTKQETTTEESTEETTDDENSNMTDIADVTLSEVLDTQLGAGINYYKNANDLKNFKDLEEYSKTAVQLIRIEHPSEEITPAEKFNWGYALQLEMSIFRDALVVAEERDIRKAK